MRKSDSLFLYTKIYMSTIHENNKKDCIGKCLYGNLMSNNLRKTAVLFC